MDFGKTPYNLLIELIEEMFCLLVNECEFIGQQAKVYS